MTARRPPRLSGYNETHQADSDSTPENENLTRSNVGSLRTGSPGKALSSHASAVVHPLLTDFGPASATQYFREALEKLRLESRKDGRAKDRTASPICRQVRHGTPRKSHKMHRTVFDSDDSEDGRGDVLAGGEDANLFTKSQELSRFQVDAWSEDEDAYPSMPRMRGGRKLRRASLMANMYGDRLGQPPHRFTSISPAVTSDTVFAPLSDLHDYRPLHSAPPQPRRPTTPSQVSPLSNAPPSSRSTEDHGASPSIEDPPATNVLGSRNLHCRCRILCLCGAEEPHESVPLRSPLRPMGQSDRSNPAKLRLGYPRGTPSKNKPLAATLFRYSPVGRVPTKPSALSRRRRPNRSQDFEEYANEKRKSWRADGEVDLIEADLELSEDESTSYLSMSASGRSRRLREPSWLGIAPSTRPIGSAAFQAQSRYPENNPQTVTQNIAQALDSLNDDVSPGLLDHGLPSPTVRRAASTRSQERSWNRTLSAYGIDETLLGASLMFKKSSDEDASLFIHRPWPRLLGSFLRSPARRRAARRFQHSGSVAGNENILAHTLSPGHAPSSAAHSSLAQISCFRQPAASTHLDYDTLTPQQVPRDVSPRYAYTHRHMLRRRTLLSGSMNGRITQPSNASVGAHTALNARAAMAAEPIILPVPDSEQQHPWRSELLSPLQASPLDPPVCPVGHDGRGWPDGLPIDIFILITKYLSHDDVRNLRLVNSTFESILVPVVFRNVVTKFGKSMFDVNLGRWEKKPPEGSMFEKYGMEIHKFGICFEIDLEGLQTATPKVIQNTQSSWWGKYTWPVPKYPRFKSLEALENLADHLPLLTGAFKDLTNVSELALCVDSGHGWLNGPDMSDLAVWSMRCLKGYKIFGQTFQAEDKWHQYGRNKLFRWAQMNTINEALQSLERGSHVEQRIAESQFLRSVAIRDFDSYAVQSEQADADPDRHTGGTVPSTNPNPPNVPHQQPFHQAGVPNWAWQVPPAPPPPLDFPQPVRTGPHGTHGHSRRQTLRNRIKKAEVTQPQWPIAYNGYNLTAETGGHCTFIQNKVADPRTFPLQPGYLTEAQAQWLMETVWAQRAFLSAYTTAILTNKANFKQVHSLHIAKLSSGLLPSLEQRELWQALPNLRTLKVLVSPDWRTEYMPGDQSFQTNMLISPVQASIKFAEFLQRYISRIEHLSTLTIGFVGGGEHATGLLARNQHVLPAPLTSDPRSWLTDHVTKPDLNTMLAFNHIKDLTIENAWVSPFMLEGFMINSKDTSLRHLTLASVSLTGTNSQWTNAPMTTVEDGLKPEYAPAAWLQERLPSDHCWPALIDRLTPAVTFSQLRYNAGLIDPIQVPPPEPSFRGNVEKLTFKSCGYVKISGVPQTELNQNGLVMPNANPRDHGLAAREILLREARGLGEMYGNVTATVMLREKDPQGHDWFGLGKLTQCIHPIEKRVLEEAWQMTFGWGNDVDRFGAVEDGFFEGGTGRFSGEVTK